MPATRHRAPRAPATRAPGPIVREAPRTGGGQGSIGGVRFFNGAQSDRGLLPQQARGFAQTNEWARSAINRLKDRVARAERLVGPLNPDRPYSVRLQARLTALIENPNPRGDSWRTFIEPVIEDILTLGKGGWEYVPNWRGWPVGLFPFDAANMRVQGDWDGSRPAAPRYLWQQPGIGNDVLGLRNEEATLILLNPSTWRPEGLSPIDTLRTSVEAEAQASTYIRSLLQKYPPPGWLELGRDAGVVEVAAVADKLQDQVLGQGGILVTGGFPDSKYTNLHNGSSRDHELQAWSIYFARKICAVFGISPQELGITMDVNRSTADSQQSISEEAGYKSLLCLIEETVNREVLAKFGPPELLNLQFSFRELTFADRMRHVELAQKMAGGLPIATYNESRQMANLPPMEQGNAVYAMTPRGVVALLGDDAHAYRRQAAAEEAWLLDEEARDGGFPEPLGGPPTPDRGPAAPSAQAPAPAPAPAADAPKPDAPEAAS